MFTRDFCLDVSLHIISVLTVATLEAESREANIFTLGVSGAVGPNTLPVSHKLSHVICQMLMLIVGTC